MAETIDEAMIIAWVDGELNAADAARVATAVATDPALAAQADRHRRLKARFAVAFGPLADEEVATPPPAPVISLAAVRAEREAASVRPAPRRWYAMGGAIAASLLAGVFAGQQIDTGAGVRDTANMLALSAPLSQALDTQLSGDPGAIRVALSFRDRDNHFCRSFTGQHLAGVACREDGSWQLRYAAPSPDRPQTDYRMAGTDTSQAQIIETMIAGEPLDRDLETKARDDGWAE